MKELLGDNLEDKKIVIFTCINKSQNIESTKRSLEFAHCINPFKLEIESEFYHKCQNTQSGGYLQRTAIDFTMSPSSVRSIERLGVFNMIKLVRWRYYTQSLTSRRKESLEAIAFKDYLATLIISMFMFATKHDNIALGIITDQIVSMTAYSILDDDRVLLLPYYLPFVGNGFKGLK
jgi:hypothetical protein